MSRSVAFLLTPLPIIVIQALIGSVDHEDMAVATGSRFKTFNPLTGFTKPRLVVSYLFRTSGQVLGVSLTGALAQSILREELRERIHGPGAEEVRRLQFDHGTPLMIAIIPPKLIREIRHTTSIIRKLEPELRDAASSSWAVALRAVFICNAAISFVLLFSCWPIQEFELPYVPVLDTPKRQVDLNFTVEYAEAL
jgi:hypothetical protein